LLVYSGLRLVLLLAVGGLLYLTGARGLLLIVLSFLLSGALSLVWLDKPRGQASAGFGRLMGRMNDKIDAAATKEDDVDTSADDETGSEAQTSEQKS